MLGSEECPGLVSLTVSELYRRVDELQSEGQKCDVAVAYFEVYNEVVRDLLCPDGSPLVVRDDPSKGIGISNLSTHRVKEADALLELLLRGNRNRTQHATDANAESSRSHAIFQVYVSQMENVTGTSKNIRASKMSFVDLAGSERAAAVSRNNGARLREGTKINLSLLALGNCIDALSKNGAQQVPYRNSKLTHILKDSLGGTCQTLMIAAVSPSKLSFSETHNTLKYAERAMKIQVQSTPAILMHTTGKNATDGNAASNDTKGGAGEAKKEGKESVELEKYWQFVRTNPADFAGWTYLLQYVEQENSLAAAREAFDKFFSYYPYCYGYWKKYAEMEKQLCSIEKAEETFERGVAAIPLSVDLWIYYINFVKVHFKDEDHYYSKVKNLFERAIESSGQDFRSDRLWDMFVTWELENKNLKEVTAIYERVLQVPTQLYGHHFEKFQEHVKTHLPKDILSTDEFLELRQQYMESMRKAVPGGADSAGGVGDEGGAPRPGVDAPPPGVEDATKEDTRALKNDNEARYIRDKVVEKRRVDFKANEAEVGRRWAFEEGIKRPYFLVQPLERLQLKNWREYLDFETQNGNHARTVTLYERCLIACALYEDMWLKYIKYLDTAEPKKVNSVFRRACTTHLVRKPSISLAWAAYEEKHGRFEEASQILAELEERIPDLLEPVLRRINVERRRGCPEKVEELYRKCISQADNVALKSHYTGKLARFLSKIQKKPDEAKEVLKEAIERDPGNSRLYMQLADLGYEQSPPSEAEVLEAFEMATGSSSQLTAADKLVFLQRKLEFLEDFGSDVLKVQEAFDEYSKMAEAQELAASKKRPAEEPQETPEKKQKPAEVNGAADAAAASAAQAIAVATSSAAADATAQYNYTQQWGSYPQAAASAAQAIAAATSSAAADATAQYNCAQQWGSYPQAAASAAQAIAAATSSAAADATAQYNYAQQWGSYPQAAYNYQQAWNAYPASSYYPTH